MTRKEKNKRLLDSAIKRNGKARLTCAQALKIAGQCKASPAEIGRLCDKAGIKIRRCKLGCFA